ncbi:MAG: glycosyltransferase [Verrucomicrobiota bacterium]|nr:glycosyltransferase [Verrucomicrobiota bacterium]
MAKRTVASYCTTFLKPEMLHIYRQVTALRTVRTFIMTKKLQDPLRFPFPDIELIPQPRMNLLRHGWLKLVKREPPIVYRGEYQMLASLLERRGADVMHIYFGHTGVHLLPFIEQWNKPCIVSFHGADVASKADIIDYERKLRRMFEAVPLILARSQSLADRLLQLGCAAERLRINRTGVPLNEFPFVRRELPAHGNWRLLQACRLIPKKGLATSIRAFAVLRKQFPEAELVIAGKGPLQPSLETLAAQLGVSRRVHFRGFLTQRELTALYSSAHLFLHPSEMSPDQNQEGVPNSILEAMATGLVVLATRHGGIPEAVEHGRTGLLVQEGDFVSLADAVISMLRSPERMNEMGWRASQSVAANFEQGEQIRQLESYYEEAIAIKRAGEKIAVADAAPLPARFPEQVRVE